MDDFCVERSPSYTPSTLKLEGRRESCSLKVNGVFGFRFVLIIVIASSFSLSNFRILSLPVTLSTMKLSRGSLYSGMRVRLSSSLL